MQVYYGSCNNVNLELAARVGEHLKLSNSNYWVLRSESNFETVVKIM
jgi:hypothetical protein